MKKWRWAAVLSFVLAMASGWIVFDNLFAPFGEESVSVEIPNLLGSVPEKSELEEWVELQTEYRYDADAPAGVVLSQSPMAGSLRKLTAESPRCTVSVVISLGEETLTLPDVVGKEMRETVSSLRSQGFAVETVMQTGAYPEGTILASEPRGGTEMPKGGKVVLTVSAGTPSKTVTVPDLRGLSRSDALVQLWLSRLSVDKVIEVDSEEAIGTVVRQSHQAGTVVAAGTRVSLSISHGIEK